MELMETIQIVRVEGHEPTTAREVFQVSSNTGHSCQPVVSWIHLRHC